MLRLDFTVIGQRLRVELAVFAWIAAPEAEDLDSAVVDSVIVFVAVEARPVAADGMGWIDTDRVAGVRLWLLIEPYDAARILVDVGCGNEAVASAVAEFKRLSGLSAHVDSNS